MRAIDIDVPDDCVVEGHVALVSWIDEEGVGRYEVDVSGQLPLSTYLGLLELAKHRLIDWHDNGNWGESD